MFAQAQLVGSMFRYATDSNVPNHNSSVVLTDGVLAHNVRAIVSENRLSIAYNAGGSVLNNFFARKIICSLFWKSINAL